jgi:hypothetical protein
MTGDAGIDPDRTECDALWRILSEYVDGCATAEDTATVERHVATCTACAADLAFLRTSSAMLRASEPIEPPAGLRDAILAATIERPSAGERVRQAFAILLTPAPVRVIAFGAVACAVVLGLMRPSGTIRRDVADQTNTFVATTDTPRSHEVAILPQVPPASSPRIDVPYAVPRVHTAFLAHDAPVPRITNVSRGVVLPKAPANARIDRARPLRPRMEIARTVPAPISNDVEPTVRATGDRTNDVKPAVSDVHVTPAEPETPVRAESAPRGEDGPRTTMVSSAYYGPGGVGKLADVCRSGREQAADQGRELAMAVIPRRQIRVDVIRGSF